MRLFVTRKAVRENGSDSLLQSVVNGDVLPTVRRADPRRQKVQVWTSGNRIFASARPDLVRLAAFTAASGGVFDGGIWLSTVEKDAIARLVIISANLPLQNSLKNAGAALRRQSAY